MKTYQWFRFLIFIMLIWVELIMLSMENHGPKFMIGIPQYLRFGVGCTIIAILVALILWSINWDK